MSSARTYSTAEAASQLGVTAPTVIRWARDGTLEGHQGQLGRKAWRIDADSVFRVLKVRGGPGARRGRPSGSVTVVTNELAALGKRVQSLEHTIARRDDTTAAALVRLVRLLQADGSQLRAQSDEMIRAAKDLEELLAPSLARRGRGSQSL